ncbi:hypothetical protein XENORESO_014577 [Xenotaenia resolanae]|uniref:Uncharacterized protein n=1 Tax=Xenotaenia resolanae TaxID=208358 RepID=A0ABV0X5E1_9TELE
MEQWLTSPGWVSLSEHLKYCRPLLLQFRLVVRDQCKNVIQRRSPRKKFTADQKEQGLFDICQISRSPKPLIKCYGLTCQNVLEDMSFVGFGEKQQNVVVWSCFAP